MECASAPASTASFLSPPHIAVAAPATLLIIPPSLDKAPGSAASLILAMPAATSSTLARSNPFIVASNLFIASPRPSIPFAAKSRPGPILANF